jgi:glycosyltransferase involved in cell wall biosynthesis
VFFPCYNEEGNVEATTKSALRACRALGIDHEIIIVNDGSADRTAQIAEKLVMEHENVRVVNHSTNLGYGSALRSGFAAATKPWVFYTDGDGQFDFDEIELLLPMVSEFDIISAYRIDRKDPMMRKINAACWGALVNTVFGMRVKDIDCAFKLFPRSLFDDMPLQSTGAMIDTEVLARATRRGYRIGQIGVHHYPRAEGLQTGANLGVILRAFKELYRLRSRIVAPRERQRTTQPKMEVAPLD